jgi:hypothetical protein
MRVLEVRGIEWHINKCYVNSILRIHFIRITSMIVSKHFIVSGIGCYIDFSQTVFLNISITSIKHFIIFLKVYLIATLLTLSNDISSP